MLLTKYSVNQSSFKAPKLSVTFRRTPIFKFDFIGTLFLFFFKFSLDPVRFLYQNFAYFKLKFYF